MKPVVFLAAILFCCAYPALQDYGRTQQNDDVPEGMTVYHIGSVNLIVPKGTRLSFKPGLITVENTTQYAARSTEEIGKRIDGLQHRIEALEKQVDTAQKPSAD